MNSRNLILTMAVVLFLAGNGCSEGGHDHAAHEHEEHKGSMKGSMKSEEFSSDAIEVGNKICPVSKQAVSVMGGAVQYEYEGKIYNLCCKMCLKDFKKNPAKYIKIVEEMMSAEHKGSHGEHNHNH